MRTYRTSRRALPLGIAIVLAIEAGCSPTGGPNDGTDITVGGTGGNNGETDGADGGSGGNNIRTVTISGMAFNPPSITIQQNETVRWTNQDFVPHTVTSGNPEDANRGSLFDSGNIARNATFEHTFNQVGTFRYHCRIHPTQMRDATVIVQ